MGFVKLLISEILKGIPGFGGNFQNSNAFEAGGVDPRICVFSQIPSLRDVWGIPGFCRIPVLRRPGGDPRSLGILPNSLP